jgi:hypothetical protein
MDKVQKKHFYRKHIITIVNRDRSVSDVTRYRLEEWGLIPCGGGGSSLLRHNQTRYATHSGFLSLG